jgi:hypothetical protein
MPPVTFLFLKMLLFYADGNNPGKRGKMIQNSKEYS